LIKIKIGLETGQKQSSSLKAIDLKKQGKKQAAAYTENSISVSIIHRQDDLGFAGKPESYEKSIDILRRIKGIETNISCRTGFL
jgi:hypothetical protein